MYYIGLFFSSTGITTAVVHFGWYGFYIIFFLKKMFLLVIRTLKLTVYVCDYIVYFQYLNLIKSVIIIILVTDIA